ncbi:MAG: hypothetical protein IPO41_05555 [Acidobacteria bacterium]|nr:hypothetical protein [Acidobacteriota bacterium]
MQNLTKSARLLYTSIYVIDRAISEVVTWKLNTGNQKRAIVEYVVAVGIVSDIGIEEDVPD